MKKILLCVLITFVAVLFFSSPASAQQYKLRQSTNMMGMRSESTVYVKGMRKRTEGGGLFGMGADIVTIQQCDLQRTVKLNDKKRLYFIEPFAQGSEEVIDEDVPPTSRNKNVSPPKNNASQKGGIITMWYSIHDTGDRKKIYGFIARHVWTIQKMMPSPDACSMKDSMMMKTDGWYIDLPQFNCPEHYRPARTARPGEKLKAECQDRFITRRSGRGKLGFPLNETTTMKFGGGEAREMETSIETLDFSTASLDSMLFEIPPGYQEAKTEDELQDKVNPADMMKDIINKAKENNMPPVADVKKPGIIRIGVYAPTGDDQVQPSMLQQHMVGTLTGGNVEAIAISSEEDAQKFKCDYTLSTGFTKVKSAIKAGGLLKAIRNADPNAASTYNIQGNLTLKALGDGSVRAEQKIDGKYDGKVDEAANKALDDGCREVLKAIK